MRLATVVEDWSNYGLTLAAQCGVEEITLRYPGSYPGKRSLKDLRVEVESYGLRATVVEGYLPIEKIKLQGAAAADEIEAMKALIREMGNQGMSVLCYNSMAGSDWVRTSTTTKERGGALTTAFQMGQVPVMPVSEEITATPESLWVNLQEFLEAVLPVAEASGVVLAMHPDDPPIQRVAGQPRIMYDVDCFERLVSLVESEANGICLCQGTFAEMGVDIPSTIRRLGQHIRYVHFRDVRLTDDGFVESFHDNGQTDMAAAIRAYREVGFDGPLRSDHVPQLIGEEDGTPGYTMHGRLFAWGYIRGLLHATSGA